MSRSARYAREEGAVSALERALETGPVPLDADVLSTVEVIFPGDVSRGPDEPLLYDMQAVGKEWHAVYARIEADIAQGRTLNARLRCASLQSLLNEMAFIDGLWDVGQPARLAALDREQAEADARRKALAVPIPPAVQRDVATRGFTIPAAPIVVPPDAPVAQLERCTSCDAMLGWEEPGFQDEAGRHWCLTCLRAAAALWGIEGRLPVACAACAGQGQVPAPADASVRVTCPGCGGRGVTPPSKEPS